MYGKSSGSVMRQRILSRERVKLRPISTRAEVPSVISVLPPPMSITTAARRPTSAA